MANAIIGASDIELIKSDLLKMPILCYRPGEKFDQVNFDLKGEINWDLKAKAIKSDDHKVILNDREAMEASIARHGYHGEVIALCDVEYNDINRSFQKWHSELKCKI